MKSQISCAPRRFADRVATTPEEAHAFYYRFLDGIKAPGMNWSDQSKRGQDFTRLAGEQARHLTNPEEHSGIKHQGSGAIWFDTGPASLPSKSPRRKFASAMIAKIPLTLSRHIAIIFRP